MYLRKLQMRGFKTFADQTEIEFGPGITAIVGPNGVGKSNIADAILWALGEQSNRTLRTNASEDVIFAGSENRRRLGMAEAALTLDNTDGELDVDFSEVTIARRLFRSGDSEYLLNHSTSRLRDIKDLLLDTGVGPDTYSIIGQGEIDAILSIRSEDRRELLEEVAGTRKYRMRRNDATRKLEATEANMTRVQDILTELQTQREPLEKEAEVAREYRELSDQLSEIERTLLAYDYQKARKRIGKLTNDLHIAKADGQATKNKISSVDAELEKLQNQMARTEDEVQTLREQAREAERKFDQAKQSRDIAKERLRGARSRKQDLTKALQRHSDRANELQQQLQQARGEYEDMTEKLRKAQQRRDKLAEKLEQKTEKFKNNNASIAELQKQRDDADSRISTLENEASALESLQEDIAERAARLSEQSKNLEQRQSQIEGSLSETRKQRDELAERLSAQEQQLADRRHTLNRATRGLKQHRQKCDILSGAITAAEAQKDVLQDLQESKEGFGDGVQKAMEAAENGQFSGVRGIVADLLDVPARFERAIEVALGRRLQWIVVDSQQQAAAAANWACEQDCPRVTFIPLNDIPPLSGTTIPDRINVHGCFGRAIKTIHTGRKYRRLFEHLLQQTVIVEDLDTAIAVQSRFRPRMRIVTLSGEVIGTGGAVTAGGEQGAGAATFARRRELGQLSDTIQTMQDAMEKMWQKEEQLDKWMHNLSGDIQRLEAEVSDLRSEHATVEADLAHLQDQKDAAAEAQQEFNREHQQLQTRLEETRQRRQQALEEAQQLQQKVQKLDTKIENLHEEGIDEAELDEIRSRHVNSKVEAAELAEKQRSLEDLVQRHEQQLQRVSQEKEETAQQLQQAKATEAELTEKIETPDEDLTELKQDAEEARDRVEQAAAEMSDLREMISRLENSRRQLQQLAEEQSDRIHRTDLAVARQEGKLQNVEEKLADTYDMTPEEAMATIDEDSTRSQLSSRASRLRKKIRELGPVDISAIDECERLKAREEFLQGQLDDLHEAREDLTEVIEEIDEVATRKFMDCFHRLQKAFQDIFARLFEGGSTELKLTNEENPLEGGVDVLVQLPGKRQQNLLLLSGGERVLTAIALIFAMLKVKPTPFCVLDEVDAALDESNIDRFVNVLRDFTDDTQFIVVTHNPQTIQAADVLFGVTMEEQGVSELIRLKLREWEEFVQQAEQRRHAMEASGSPSGS